MNKVLWFQLQRQKVGILLRIRNEYGKNTTYYSNEASTESPAVVTTKNQKVSFLTVFLKIPVIVSFFSKVKIEKKAATKKRQK